MGINHYTRRVRPGTYMSCKGRRHDLFRRTLLIVICWSNNQCIGDRKTAMVAKRILFHSCRIVVGTSLLDLLIMVRHFVARQYYILSRASSIKLQASSCDVFVHMKVKKILIKENMAFIANAAQDGRQLKLDEARRLVHKTCVARSTART